MSCSYVDWMIFWSTFVSIGLGLFGEVFLTVIVIGLAIKIRTPLAAMNSHSKVTCGHINIIHIDIYVFIKNMGHAESEFSSKDKEAKHVITQIARALHASKLNPQEEAGIKYPLTIEEESNAMRACTKAGLTKLQTKSVMLGLLKCEHLGTTCTFFRITPIIGPRYTAEKKGITYNICEEAYNSLPEDKRGVFSNVLRPNIDLLIKAAKKLKVTLLSGFLDEKLNIAVIVNDMGEINLDADEIKETKLIQEEAQMVEMHNGCICCTLRGDLLKTVKLLSLEKNIEYLVIESTGISEPLPVAQTFAQPSSKKSKQSKGFVVKGLLDTLCTVVDALNFFEKSSTENPGANDKKSSTETVDDRSIAQLMIDQIEFSNVIIISKVALITDKRDEKIKKIKALLRKLCPKARILELLNTKLFNMKEIQTSSGWLAELRKGEHTPETEEYGISSLVFREKNMPFHPERFFQVLKTGFKYNNHVFTGVVRSKGLLWFANANAFPMAFHTAGKQVDIKPNPMPFIAAKPEPIRRLKLAGKWSEKWGDRQSELVLIGVDLDKEKIRKLLRSALLTEEESKALGGVSGWKNLKDPIFGSTLGKQCFELRFKEPKRRCKLS
eukprot:GSMAST32.ASY1.ANO1.162.1 assembled CDS